MEQIGELIMKKCGSDELARILNFYRFVIDETEGMSVFARWIYGKHPTEEQIRDYIKQGNMYYSEEGSHIVAAVAVTPYQTDEYHDINWQIALKDDEVAVVHLLGVNPHFQKGGTAKAMVREIVNLAKNEGKKAVRLDALECNIPAHRLYESLGFQKRDVRNWYASNTGWINFYLFEYLL